MDRRPAGALLLGRGIEEDYVSRGSAGGKRQLTLIQEEHLPAITSLVHADVDAVRPETLRRNLVIGTPTVGVIIGARARPAAARW